MSLNEILYLIVGIVLLGVTSADIVKTTLSSNGGGFFTATVTRGIWKIFFAAAGRRARSSILNHAGMAVLVAILVVWIAGLWIGLFLVLLSDPNSIVSSNSESATSVLEKFYYAGFSLSTLGVGDYKATSNVWRIITSTSAFTGLVFITTSVTYFVPVLSAVNLQSRIALYIQSMGKTPQAILGNSWNGHDFSAFLGAGTELQIMLIEHTLHHRSYPVLHYFHNTNPALSIKLCMVQFAEAFYLFRYAVSHSNAESLKSEMIDTTLRHYFEAMEKYYALGACEDAGPMPDVEELRKQGLPLHEPAKIRESFSKHIQAKQKLVAPLLFSDGWTWEDVYRNS